MLDKLKKAIEGWTIHKVEFNSKPEGTVTLWLTQPSQTTGQTRKRTIRLWGTSMGWWFTQDKDRGAKPPQSKTGRNANYLEKPHCWTLLPPLAGYDNSSLEPLKGITLDRQAAALWKGVMVYRTKKAKGFVAFFGAIWASGSRLDTVQYGTDLYTLTTRIESNPLFTELQRQPRDPRVTMQWEDAP